MTDGVDEYRGWFVEWIEQWSQIIQGCNWRTFHAINIEFEDDRMMGGVETTWVLLGLGFRVRWNYAETERVRLIKNRVEDIKSGRVG